MTEYLEQAIKYIRYDDMNHWRLPDIISFSSKIRLYDYQEEALKSIIKVLYKYFADYETGAFEAEIAKQRIYELCQNEGLENFSPEIFNRACFWMATGSGKSIVLIKTIELLDYLAGQGLIPKKEIMLLLPREDLIDQFKAQLSEYNKNNQRIIELVNLRKYEQDKFSYDSGMTIKVYYTKSNLLREEQKENILNYRSYLNDGNWYVFLDEAHRGQSKSGGKATKNDLSKLKKYVTELSSNGFLFNFSATFTDEIDHATTCYNFNLEKFITEGYGKNIYLIDSYFDFNPDDEDDFSEREKQKQVLKSFMIFSLIKISKKEGFYHAPLMITLVNSVNTEDSDLQLFFREIEKICNGKVDDGLFNEVKQEMKDEFSEEKEYYFGEEKFKIGSESLDGLKIDDILECVFNAKETGKIEVIMGEADKEIALKLESSDQPFALIKIGDAGKFQRDKLGDGYIVTDSLDGKYFENINERPELNILLGSRSFYEGWDSNRPNVLNLVNIGKSNAQKYVLQSIGRGIRIEPQEGNRKRLKAGDSNKNFLMETLFIFSTDKNAVRGILSELSKNKNQDDENVIKLDKNENILFDLLIPTYKDETGEYQRRYFHISQKSLENFKTFFRAYHKQTFLLKYGIGETFYKDIFDGLINNNLFQYKEGNDYLDNNILLKRIIENLSVKRKEVDKIE